MEYKNIILEIEKGVALLTINRPQMLNVLNAETIEEMNSAVAGIKDNPRVSALIICGAGDRAFAAGADIKEIKALTPLSAESYLLRGHSLFNSIELLGKPVIAAVNGFALGGGTELALACHIRIASEEAKFGLPELKLGIIPGYGGNLRLPRVVGRAKALEMILTGETIDAREAHRIGLVNHVVKKEDLIPKSREIAATIGKRGPIAVKYAIETVIKGSELTFEESISLEINNVSLLCGTEDKKEGTTAFLEKREPSFKRK